MNRSVEDKAGAHLGDVENPGAGVCVFQEKEKDIGHV